VIDALNERLKAVKLGDLYANPAGFKQAEAEAHRIATLLAIGKFNWTEF
jgi:hypothetical protein